jgi:hypothetical protein
MGQQMTARLLFYEGHEENIFVTFGETKNKFDVYI